MILPLFFLGAILTLVAPLLGRYRVPPFALAGGAAGVLAAAIIGLITMDPRIGQAAVETNRREYIFCAVCEALVLTFAVISWKGFKWAFWLGWSISLAFSLFVLWVIVELEFFWHW